MKKTKAVLHILAMGVLTIGTAGSLLWTSLADAAQVKVYKSPTCGCCSKWEEHLKKQGFEVKSELRSDLDRVKSQYKVPTKLASCHTAVVDGYVIEGHVPADLIQRLITKKPKGVVGISVPGMPIGSPGMEGGTPEPYQVLTFDADGRTTVFAER